MRWSSGGIVIPASTQKKRFLPLVATVVLIIVRSVAVGYRTPSRQPISCFSCASEEYEPLYMKSSSIYSFGQPMQFDRSCDSSLDLENFAPVIRCDSTCVTVLEPQYFGGVLNEKKPYTFVRGCATDIFAVFSMSNGASFAGDTNGDHRYRNGATSYTRDGSDTDYHQAPRLHHQHPAEIDFLHRAEMCTSLPIQELWPELFSSSSSSTGASQPEFVQVCSCASDACNRHDTVSAAAKSTRPHSLLTVMSSVCLVVLLQLLRTVLA